VVGSGTNGATPEETPTHNWAKNRECQRTPPDSAGFFILAVRSFFRAKARSAAWPWLCAWMSPPDLVDGRASIMDHAPVLRFPTGLERGEGTVETGNDKWLLMPRRVIIRLRNPSFLSDRRS
jgi:hypothetical protein